MSMDLAVLQAVARELDEELRGGFINKIYQPLPRDIVLAVRLSGGGGRKLVLSADPRLGRIHLTTLRIPNPPRPPRLCAFLRAHVQGGRICEIRAAPTDRVVRISTVRGQSPTRSEHDIVLELLGRDSNILVVDRSSNLIVECLHRIPWKETGSRAVMPGIEYSSPPGRPDPTLISRVQDRESAPAPGITRDPQGRKRLTDRAVAGRDMIFSSMNEAADSLYGEKVEKLLLEAARREAASPLKARIRSLDRRLEKIEADERRLEVFAAYEHEGELLKGNLHRMKKGMDRIEVEDWSTGRPLSIALDPRLSPVENMEHMFRKAAKARRGRSRVKQRLEETKEEKRALEELLYFVERAVDHEELEDIAALAGPRKNETGRHRESRPKEAGPAPEPFYTFRSPSGKSVLVGKSARGNDFLLRKKASKEDLWLHVNNLPGAHVLLRTEGREESPEDIAYCARLAVEHSKARGKGKTDVIVARVKDLERPKGALPGQVRVKHYWTIVAEASEG